MQEEVKRLREEIEELNTSIKYVSTSYVSHPSYDIQKLHRHFNTLTLNCFCLLSLLKHSFCQEQLPATGVPIRQHRIDHMQEKFNEYVKNRTLQNWKFWIVSFSERAYSDLHRLLLINKTEYGVSFLLWSGMLFCLRGTLFRSDWSHCILVGELLCWLYTKLSGKVIFPIICLVVDVCFSLWNVSTNWATLRTNPTMIQYPCICCQRCLFPHVFIPVYSVQ